VSTELKKNKTEPLAIVGIGCMFPKAASAKAFWSNIKEGVDAITEIPATHWKPSDYFDQDKTAPDMTYARRGGFLDPIDFDPLLYGMSPKNIEATDTTQLLGMVAAREALLDAGYSTSADNKDGRPFNRDRTSVILGVTGTLELVIPLGARLGHPIWRKALKDAGIEDDLADEVVKRIAEEYVPWQENSFPGLLGNVAAGRIANRFDLGGTNCVVDAACASSLSAIHMAAMELYAGRCDMAITGGLDTFNDIFMYMCFSKTPALSPTGNSRPFHANGDGTILGEGMGVTVLKRLSDAKKDNDHIYAVLKSIGSSSDGKGNAVYAPSVNGQKKALRFAYEEAGVTPGSIELVEAHGTGTKAGDAVEAEALSEIYREDQEQGTWCAIGSVKSMIGHTKAAAGAAGLIKAVMALQHKVLPPTIKIDQLLEILEPGKAPVYVNTIKRPWVSRPDHPRRAAVSAFGFGGSNFHAVLEEAEVSSEIDWDGNVLLCAFSANSKEDIKTELAKFKEQQQWNSLRKKAAESLQNFNQNKQYRLIIIIERNKTTVDKLTDSAIVMLSGENDSWSTPDGAYFGSGKKAGKLAFLFPGQGSQYPGMLLDLACQFPQMLSSLELANTSVGLDDDGMRLSDRIYPIPVFEDQALERDVKALRETATAQPAIGAISSGAKNILEYFGMTADATAGHSFGELSALACSGVYGEENFYKLAKKRGELMQQGNGDNGGMLAVIATPSDLYTLIEEHQLDLIIANHNAHSQVVLSGNREQITKAESILSEKKIRSQQLSVSAAFHSVFVADAEKPFAQFMDGIKFKRADIPVYSNTTAEVYPTAVTDIPALLAGQLVRPVEFVSQIENMYQAGIQTFIEVGPSNTITGLVSSILKEKDHNAVALDASKDKKSDQFDLACLLAKVGVLGHKCNIERWDENYLKDLREEKKPAMSIPLSGANYVMPRERSKPITRKPQVAPQQVAPQQEMKIDKQTRQASAKINPNQFSAALQTTQQSILALQKMQKQTSQLHRQYLLGQEESQRTIRRLVEQQQSLLNGIPITPLTNSETVYTATHEKEQAAVKAPVEIEQTIPGSPTDHAQTGLRSVESAKKDSSQYEHILLGVVAEKTGYPIEMLSLDMSLDTDLGIDSIKRVEILSALQERLPDARQIEPEELGTFQLLLHIVEYLDKGNAETTVGSAQQTVSNVIDTTIFENALLEVVADKTDYPMEMLNLNMNLDSDLGIDFIKRVEILSTLQERLPDTLTVKPEELGALQTLQQIVEHMQRGSETVTEVESKKEAVISVENPAEGSITRSVVEVSALAEKNRKTITIDSKALVWVTDDGTELAEKVCEALQRRNLNAQLVQLDKKAEKNVAALIIMTPTTANSQFIQMAFNLIRQLGKQTIILTSVTRLGGAFGIEDLSSANPVSGGIAGIIKTADKEWANANCKAIDIPANRGSAKLVEAIVDEILTEGPLEVGISKNQRCTLSLNTIKLNDSIGQNPFRKGDSLVITGGARGVTAEVALSLAQHYQTNLLLLGRSLLPENEPEWLSQLKDEAEIKKAIISRQAEEQNLTPKAVEEKYRCIIANREILTNLKRIEISGVSVEYRSVDVRDAEEVANVISMARNTLGPVRGFVHGAGVLSDRYIEDKTEEQFNKVFSTKIDGLQALLNATEKDDLKAIVMFSSSTGRFGRKGQVDYAAANEALNKVAQQQQTKRPDCRVISVNWGPWDGGMVTPQLKKVFHDEDIKVIPLKVGAEYLAQEIATKGPVEIVILGSSDQQINVSTETAATDDSLQLAFTRKLNIKDYPVLRDHVINGKAVLPAALAVEWLAHGAMHNNPGAAFIGFDDLRILKGVILENGDNEELSIMVGQVTIKDDIDFVSVELHSSNNIHVRAKILLSQNYPQALPSTEESPTGKFLLSKNEFYSNGQLFHGTSLQGIESISACSEKGIIASVASAPPPSAWTTNPVRSSWLLDPLILDASFQLMILWSFQNSNNGSLPTAIGKYRQFQSKFPVDGIEITARIEKNTSHAAIVNIEFMDKQGKLVAKIESCECVIDGSLNSAFTRNTLRLQTEN